MHFHRPVILALPLLCLSFGGCDPDDTSVGVDSSALTCECEPPTAADVAYDNTTSALAGSNTQSAIDELAARSAPDFADRITVVANTQSATAGDTLDVGAGCGGSQGDFLTIGVSCEDGGGAGDAFLTSTELTEGGAVCRWKKPAGTEYSGTAKVVCLSLLP